MCDTIVYGHELLYVVIKKSIEVRLQPTYIAILPKELLRAVDLMVVYSEVFLMNQLLKFLCSPKFTL